MAQPTPYTPTYDFSDWQAAHPSDPLPGDEVDIQLNLIKTFSQQVCTNLAKIQRDDGALANNSVGIDQLSAELDFGFATLTTWVTAHAYVPRDGVYFGANVYRCVVAHTSDTFSTDLAAGKWVLVANFQQFLDAAALSASNAATSAGNASTSATLSQDWAQKTNGQVAATDYSSKAYAIGGTGIDNLIGSAKAWAVNGTSPDGTTNQSAKTYALQAAASASSASTNANFNATTTGGTANAVTATTGCTALAAGQFFRVVFDTANTVTAPTIQFDGLAAKTIKKLASGGGTGKIGLAPASEYYVGFVGWLYYDGTDMILMNPSSAQLGTAIAAAATTALATATGDYVNLTGTTGITAFTANPGQVTRVYYSGAGLSITLSATLAFGSATSGTLTLATGDYFEVRRDGTVYRIVDYCPAAGTVNIAGAQTILGAKTLSALLTANLGLNVSGAPLNVNGGFAMNGTTQNTDLALNQNFSSGSQNAFINIITRNENGFAVGTITSRVLTDGSSEFQITATPPGARTSDRQKLIAIINANGVTNYLQNKASGGLSKTSDITFADIPGFTWDLGVGVYHIRVCMRIDQAAAGGHKTQCSFSGALTAFSSAFRTINNGATAFIGAGMSGSVGALDNSGTGTINWWECDFWLNVSTAGTFKIQGAQNASNATSTNFSACAGIMNQLS